MQVLTGISVLLLTILGVSGCASIARMENRGVPVREQSPPTSSSADESPSTGSPPALEADEAFEHRSPATRENDSVTLRTPDAAMATPPATAEPQESDPKRDENVSPPPAATFEPDQAVADNRLLELLDKDLDKAVAPLMESRRLQFSQEVIDHPRVRHFIEYYSVTAKNRFHELLARSGKYLPMIGKVLMQEGLPEELGFLALLESEFVVNARSRSGAVGLWQFIAPTARRYGLRIDAWVDERRDPLKSTRAAAAYLKDLHDYYGRWFLATAAYNTGPGNVNKALRKSRAKDFWSIKARLSEETRNFVPRFVAIVLIASDPEKYGFRDIPYQAPLDYEQIELTVPMKLETLARFADTDVATIKDLNPAFLGHITPPSETAYRVNLPVGQASVFQAKLNGRPLPPARVVTHRVKKGESLSLIARRYGLSVRALMDFNGLKTSHLRIGQRLAILLVGIRDALR